MLLFDDYLLCAIDSYIEWEETAKKTTDPDRKEGVLGGLNQIPTFDLFIIVH